MSGLATFPVSAEKRGYLRFLNDLQTFRLVASPLILSDPQGVQRHERDPTGSGRLARAADEGKLRHSTASVPEISSVRRISLTEKAESPSVSVGKETSRANDGFAAPNILVRQTAEYPKPF